MGCVAPTMFGADDGRDRIAQTTTAFATSGATKGRIVAVRRPAPIPRHAAAARTAMGAKAGAQTLSVRANETHSGPTNPLTMANPTILRRIPRESRRVLPKGPADHRA